MADRRLNQRILELQSQVEEREQTPAAAAASSAPSSRLYSLEQELQNKTMQIGEMEIRLAEQGNHSRRAADEATGFVC